LSLRPRLNLAEAIMLTIGTDSYITALEADEYLDNNYTRLNSLRVNWSVLPAADKDVYLRQAAGRIDALLLQGQKYEPMQVMQFPRRRAGRAPFIPVTGFMPLAAWLLYGLGDSPVVPPNVKAAQAEEAIALLAKELGGRSDAQMRTMQTLGAMKNIKHNKREMGDVGAQAIVQAPTPRAKALESDRAAELLKPWTNGGFRI